MNSNTPCSDYMGSQLGFNPHIKVPILGIN